MKKRVCLIALSAIAMFSLKVSAQLTTVSATGGTQGGGLDVKYSPIPDYGVRAGFSILPVNTSFNFTAQSRSSGADVKVNFQNAHLMFDWHPFNHPGGYGKFILTAGGGYFWKNSGTAVITSTGSYNYGDIVVTPQNAGHLNGTVTWRRVAPYGGIGFESAVPQTRFNIGFALGTYYLGSPKTNLTGTSLVSVSDANQAQFQKNLENYRFLPVVQLNLNYSFN
jgi:hypothetical protein